jgi:uncharacterized protein YaaQ
MKMVMAVMPYDEAEFVLNALVIAGFGTTFAETHGGMLRQTQVSIFTAVKDDQLDEAFCIIRDNCRVDIVETRTQVANPGGEAVKQGSSKSGGAVVFCWDIDRMEIY